MATLSGRLIDQSARRAHFNQLFAPRVELQQQKTIATLRVLTATLRVGDTQLQLGDSRFEIWCGRKVAAFRLGTALVCIGSIWSNLDSVCLCVFQVKGGRRSRPINHKRLERGSILWRNLESFSAKLAEPFGMSWGRRVNLLVWVACPGLITIRKAITIRFVADSWMNSQPVECGVRLQLDFFKIGAPFQHNLAAQQLTKLAPQKTLE